MTNLEESHRGLPPRSLERAVVVVVGDFVVGGLTREEMVKI
jgi:hypothetical protein